MELHLAFKSDVKKVNTLITNLKKELVILEMIQMQILDKSWETKPHGGFLLASCFCRLGAETGLSLCFCSLDTVIRQWEGSARSASVFFLFK